MADRFEQLKLKYQSVLNFIQAQGMQLQNLNMEGDKLLIRATASSADLKNRVWDQIKLVDPGHPGTGGSCGGSCRSGRRNFNPGCANLHSASGRQSLENQQTVLRRRQQVHEDFRGQQRQAR
jgi:hypothetical protein